MGHDAPSVYVLKARFDGLVQVDAVRDIRQRAIVWEVIEYGSYSGLSVLHDKGSPEQVPRVNPSTDSVAPSSKIECKASRTYGTMFGGRSSIENQLKSSHLCGSMFFGSASGLRHVKKKFIASAPSGMRRCIR